MTTATMDADQLLALYEQMAVIRRTEKAAHDLFLAGLVKGTTHLAAGHEAVAVGASASLRPDDYVFATYRGHHHAMARGATPEECLAELMSKATGVCKAKGGSMHLTKASAGHARLLRDRRRAPADRGRGRLVGEAPGFQPGCRGLLRGRRDQYRGLPRGAQHRVSLVPSRAVHLREQPLHGVHADRLGDRGAEPGRRPGARLRDTRRGDRRQRRRRGGRRRRQGGRAGQVGPGPHGARGPHLPSLRAQQDRSRDLPPAGGSAGMAGTGPARHRQGQARRARGARRAGDRGRRPRGRPGRGGGGGGACRAAARSGRAHSPMSGRTEARQWRT